MAHDSGKEREALLADRLAEASAHCDALEKQLVKCTRKNANLQWRLSARGSTADVSAKKLPELTTLQGEDLGEAGSLDVIIDVSLKHGAGVMKAFHILQDFGHGWSVLSILLHRWRKTQLREWCGAVKPRDPRLRLGQLEGGSSPMGLRMQAIVNQQPVRDSVRTWHRAAISNSIAEEHVGVEMAQQLQILHHKTSDLQHRKGCMALLR